MTTDDIRAMYPFLNEQGVSNYTAMANRVTDPVFQVEVAIRKAKGVCLLQPDIEGGKPWTGWCLTHDVADTMDHHFGVNKGAFND